VTAATVTWRSSRPLDFPAWLERTTRWGADTTNVIRDGSYLRVASPPGGPFVYRARPLADGRVEVAAATPDRAGSALEDLRHRLAESLPFEPVEQVAGTDRRVATLLDRFRGQRPPMLVDPFETIVRSITAQQVNLRFAATIRSRLIERHGKQHSWEGTPVWEFPTAARLAEASISELREMQFSTRKAEYIVGVARAALDGALGELDDLSNEQVIERVTSLRGVGRWTADWLLARCLARPDAVAAGDLGVRKAVSFVYLDEDDILPEEAVRSIVERWGDAANWVVHLLLEELARS
jgi:DNA-3-methyladenine glycosylase II